MDLRNYRQQYNKGDLERDQLDEDPFIQFEKLFTKAKVAGVSEPNAMTLATFDEHFGADARIVLLKEVVRNEFVFFTNYNSHKGKEMEENPFGCLVFFWKELERQIRITGGIEKVSAAESDEYFYSRPEGSRIGAWASPQSSVIPSRETIETNIVKYEKEFTGTEITRPPHWGGYIVKPTLIEFWQGRPNRLHDRVQYSKLQDGIWSIERLAP